MHASAKLEIHFHDQQLASIVLESVGGPDEQFTELLLFCSFALRQMVNLGENSAARMLAELLVRAEPHLRELAHHDSPDGAKLVQYQGAPGRKRFLASLTRTDDRFNFQMKPKGFGWFAAGVGYYAPQSVMLLLRYLSLKRIDDQPYLRSLAAAAATCGRAFLAGTVSLMNQTQIAGDAATASTETSESRTPSARPVQAAATETSEPRTPSAPPVQAPDVAPPAGGHATSVEGLLRSNGEQLAIGDLIEGLSHASQSGSAVLTFEKLDQATRMAFLHLAKQQADIFRSACTAAASVSQDDLQLEVGKGVFAGYAIGRRLLETPAKPASISQDSQDAQLKGQLILKQLESVKPVDFLRIAGGHVYNAVEVWAECNARDGIYSKLPDGEAAGILLFGTLLNGFSLAIAEYQIANPSTKNRFSHEDCVAIGQALAGYAIEDFQRDHIDELKVLDFYSTLSPVHKATWLSLRLALQLRCIGQIPSLSDDHHQIISTVTAQTFAGASLGITCDRFVELQAFERSMCGIQPRAASLLPERPATQYLLFGFIGCFVNNCNIQLLGMKRKMARLDLIPLNGWLLDRGATVEIPLDPYAMLEYSRLALEKVQFAKTLVNRADQIQ